MPYIEEINWVLVLWIVYPALLSTHWQPIGGNLAGIDVVETLDQSTVNVDKFAEWTQQEV
jgi:hypothetical protein